MAVCLRRLIFPGRQHKVSPGKIHLCRWSFKRSSWGKIEDIPIAYNYYKVKCGEQLQTSEKLLLSKIERRTGFHYEGIKNIQRDLYHFIYRECCHKDGFFFNPEGSLAMNGEYKSIWKWNYITNLGLSPKISNVDDVALTVMWPSTLMRILYLSPSTTLCLQIDSHHARERGGEEGTRRTTKEGGGRWSSGGGGLAEAAAAEIVPSPPPDVAGGEAADLGGCRVTARRRRGVGRPPAPFLLLSVPPPSYRRSGGQIRHARSPPALRDGQIWHRPSPPALGGGQIRGWWSRRLGTGDVGGGGGQARPEASARVQWAASTTVFFVGF
uniref:Uncharacterized protein n=1 Tax=Oryza meridionalis TaxID=40149 RepID=A0A0E0EW86_9ORYZ